MKFLLCAAFLLSTLSVAMNSSMYTTHTYNTILVIRYTKAFQQKVAQAPKPSSLQSSSEEQLKRYRDRIIQYCISYHHQQEQKTFVIGQELDKALEKIPSHEQELHYILHGGTPPPIHLPLLA